MISTERKVPWLAACGVVVLLSSFGCGETAAPTPEPPPAPPAATEQGVDGIATSADGVEIGYTVWHHPTATTAIVLVHGWMCDRGYWREQTEVLARDHTVVTLDLAGHGSSGTDREAWELDRFGDDVAAVVEALELGSVVLVGHSMGGPAVLAAAPRLADKVLGVVGVDTFHNAEAKPAAEQWEALMTAYRADFGGTCEQFVTSMFREDTAPELVESIRGDMCGGPAEIGVALMERFGAYELGPALEASAAPVRAINANGAFATAVETNRAYSPDFEVRLVDDVGHFLMLENPAAFNEQLRSVIVDLETE